MCYKEKNKYTYLSMCSCCNAVSKYSSVVRKHLLKQHKTLPETTVIPIRIENRFERKIKKTLDRATAEDSSAIKRRTSITSHKKTHVNSKVRAGVVGSKKRVKQREISRCTKNEVKCVVCDDVFSDCTRYLFHLVSSHSNCDFKVSFKCLYCKHTVQCFKDMQDHCEKKHKGKWSPTSLIHCIHVEFISEDKILHTQKNCPYCELKFEELHNLNDHIVETHADSIETVLIAEDITGTVENQSLNGSDFLMVFHCPSCIKSFHTLQDIWEHIKDRHGQIKTDSKPKRKRKPPKWMENDFEEKNIKKPRYSSKSSNTLVVSSTQLKKGVKLPVMKKDANMKQFSATEGKQKSLQGTVSKKSHPLKVAKVTLEIVDDSVKTGNVEVKGKTDCDAGEIEPEFNDIDKDYFGDSGDDFVPDDNGSDTEVELEEESNDPLNCDFCEKSFTSKLSLDKHTKLKHSAGTDTGNKKNVKKMKLRNRDVKTPIKEDKGNAESEIFIAQYKCPFCELKLHHFEYVRNHIIQCHPEITFFRLNAKKMVEAKLVSEDDFESFQCPNQNCEFVFKKKRSLKEHMVTCTEEKLGQENIVCTMPKAWMEKLKKSVDLICPYCQIVIKGKDLFEEHLLQHGHDKEFEVELNDVLPSQQPQKDASKWPELECIMCAYCDLVSTKKINISKHIKRFHSNEKSTDVVFCILVNKSSSKDKAKLIVKDIKNVTSIKNDSQSLKLKSMGDDEENTENITTTNTMDIDKNAEVACLDKSIGDSNTAKSEENKKLLSKGKEIKGNEVFETVSIQSTIPSGKYLCPLCEFKTGLKREIKAHMNEHNSKSNEDVDSMYIIPDSWIKVDWDNTQPFMCQLCSHEELNLTLAFRHILSTHKDKVNEPSSDPHSSEVLFEVVNGEIEGVRKRYEKEKYRCSSCEPEHIFKTKKGLQLHLKTRHTDIDSIAVYETMYKMLDLIADSCNTRQMYVCGLCPKGLLDVSDLEHHFNEDHPDKLDKLKHKLRSQDVNSDGVMIASPTCEVCCKQFTDAKSLNHHLILHMNKIKPTCTLCNICFTNHAELETHNNEAHSKVGEMCDICGAMFLNKAKLKRHVKWHETGEFAIKKSLCQYCGASITGRNMKKHLVDKHVEMITCDCDICTTQYAPLWKKRVTCEQCGAIFCTWYNLKAHKYREHVMVYGEPFKCKYCDSTFKTKREQSLHSHKCGSHIGSTPSEQDSGFTTIDDRDIIDVTKVIVSEKANTNINFSLGLAYVKKEFIVIDKKSEQPYSCKICGKAFTKMRYIYNHLRRMHTKDETKPYRCKICKMGFIGKKAFSAHCRIHLDLRQFTCKICHKRYKTAAHLKEHSEIHSLHTYSCEYCGLEFKQRGALLSHVVHHDKTKPFKCLYCNKGHTTHGDLQRHMNSYSKKSKITGARKLTFCNYCSKDLPNHNALVKHFQIHLPINPFQCTVCQDKFASFRNMYNHKSKKKHFTGLERDEGRKDLRAPGNRFRKYQVSKSKTEVSKSYKRSTYMEDPEADNAISVIANDDNIVEVEIDSSVVESDERAKSVLDMFENNVFKSMLDASPEIMNTVEFHTTDNNARKDNQTLGFTDKSTLQDGYQFEIQEVGNYPRDVLLMPNVYDPDRHDVDFENSFTLQNRTNIDNSEKLASVVAESIQHEETVSGKTQTFQASDGSIIHVCVIKPDK